MRELLDMESSLNYFSICYHDKIIKMLSVEYIMIIC